MYGPNQYLARLWNDECGISSVEYALLLAFVVSGIMVAAETLGNAMVSEISDSRTCTETNGNTCS